RILRLQVEVSDYDANRMTAQYEKLKRMAAEGFPGADVQLVGQIPELIELNSLVAKGTIISFFIAILVITLLMILVFKNIKAGLIGLIPNLMPALVIGGIFGFSGIPLNMVTMTIIPMILGLAVDDTIHFITHLKKEVQNSGNYTTAITESLQRVGKALFMTSVILMLAFSVYMTSTANMFFHLGAFIFIGILVALLADFTLTPILFKLTKPFKENYK
ncbi:MAG: MMPL family transporter, partial [bacterium]|nr:MMPL family transporter [bacterium]